MPFCGISIFIQHFVPSKHFKKRSLLASVFKVASASQLLDPHQKRKEGGWTYLLHYWLWWVWQMRYFRTLMWSHLCWWASLSRRHSQLTALNTQDTNSGTHRVNHSPTHPLTRPIGTLRCDSRVRLMATSFIELRTSCSNFLPSCSGQVFEALPFEKCLTGYKLDRVMRRTDRETGGQVNW